MVPPLPLPPRTECYCKDCSCSLSTLQSSGSSVFECYRLNSLGCWLIKWDGITLWQLLSASEWNDLQGVKLAAIYCSGWPHCKEMAARIMSGMPECFESSSDQRTVNLFKDRRWYWMNTIRRGLAALQRSANRHGSPFRHKAAWHSSFISLILMLYKLSIVLILLNLCLHADFRHFLLCF